MAGDALIRLLSISLDLSPFYHREPIAKPIGRHSGARQSSMKAKTLAAVGLLLTRGERIPHAISTRSGTAKPDDGAFSAQLGNLSSSAESRSICEVLLPGMVVKE